MQYILSETEYAALQSRIAGLESTNSSLATDLLKASHKLDVAAKVREADRQQLADLAAENQTYCDQLVECKRDMKGTLKTLEETKSESLFRLKSAQNLQAEVERLEDQIAYFRNLAENRDYALLKIKEECNALQASLKKAQSSLEHSEHLSERRLRLANELQTQVQRLKHEPVAIVLSPSKRYRAVSLDKVDTYERFGWVVLDEGYVVDRPA